MCLAAKEKEKMKKKITKIAVCLLSVVMIIGACVGFAACGKDEYLFGKETTSLGAQLDILTNMSNGSADVGVMDSVMANYYMANSDYKTKMEILPFDLSEEEYGIGAKKGNDALTSKINEGIIALAQNGTLKKIGDEFGLSSENLVTENTPNPLAKATDESWNKVVSAKKIIIGYTVFAPIAFEKEKGGALTGYDIELARAVVAYLNGKYSANIECEFTVIEWSAKETMLENGSIDLVWNGMTINEERKVGMSLSIPYLSNKQAIIIMTKDKANYDLTSLDAFKKSASNAIVAVEAGSAAEELMIIKK